MVLAFEPTAEGNLKEIISRSLMGLKEFDSEGSREMGVRFFFFFERYKKETLVM